jgi:hypothetical protein
VSHVTRSLAFLLLSLLVSFPLTARAADRSIDVEGAAFVGSGNPTQIGLQAAIGYRPERSYSLGVVASIAKPIGIACALYATPMNAVIPPCDAPTWTRAAFEARWHALTTRLADGWLGVEVGLAHEGTPPESRFAPRIGAGAGLAVYLVPAFSISVETRASLTAFDSQTNETFGVRGVTPNVFAGFVLGVHVPM